MCCGDKRTALKRGTKDTLQERGSRRQAMQRRSAGGPQRRMQPPAHTGQPVTFVR